MHASVLIEDLAIILCIAGFVILLFQKIKQPIVLGYLIAGIIIGPYTPPFSLIDDVKDIRILAELGVIFLMFSLGLEFSFRKLSKIGFPSVIIGVFEVVTMIIIGYYAGLLLLGGSVVENLLLGAALSISSTTIIIKALEDFNLKKEFFAHLIVGVLLIEDLLAILLMVFVTTTLTADSYLSVTVLWAFLQLLGVVISWFLVGYFIVPFFMRAIQKVVNHETLTIISVGLCLFLSALASYFNYSSALGGFIMGSILAETPQVRRIETLTLPIRDVFAAVFFVSVGMLIDPAVIYEYWPLVLLLSLITILGKIFTSSLGALIAGQDLSTALKLGFSMAQIGEFSFIIIGLGSTVIYIGEKFYSIVVAIAAITTFTTPYLIKASLKISAEVNKKLPYNLGSMLSAYDFGINRFLENQTYFNSKDLIRFIINTIIVTIIFSLSYHFSLASFLTNTNLKTASIDILQVFLTLVFASPFIYAILFETAKNKVIMNFLFWLTAFLATAFFIITKLGQTKEAMMTASSFVIFFLIFFPLLRKIYHFLESRLLKNISKRERIIFPNLMPGEYELTHIQVHSNFPLINLSLEECRLTSAFGIHVIAIKRDGEVIWLPSPSEKVFGGDELVVFGDSEELGGFSSLRNQYWS